MLNSDKFLAAFKDIEYHLRKTMQDEKRRLRFYDLLDQCIAKIPALEHFQDDLKMYANLRNTLVHENVIIVEPNQRAVEDIERIREFILRPPKVFPTFKREVLTLQKTDSIGSAVELMQRFNFSQIPVLDGQRFVNLLTSNTVARWLGKSVHEEIFSLAETNISKVLQFTEDKDVFEFRSKTTTIFEAIQLFKRFEHDGKRLEALLITPSGSRSELIVGIMTIYDLPRAIKLIGE